MDSKAHAHVSFAGKINTELNKAAANDFDGFPYRLISGDDIIKNGEKYLQIEKLPHRISNGAYIVNTANQHWWVMIVQHPSIFVIDPFGVYINGPPPNQLIDWAKERDFKTIYASEADIQNIKSNECGYICLYIVKKLKPKIGTLTEEKFDDWIDNTFYDLNSNQGAGIKNTKKVFDWISQNIRLA